MNISEYAIRFEEWQWVDTQDLTQQLCALICFVSLEDNLKPRVK